MALQIATATNFNILSYDYGCAGQDSKKIAEAIQQVLRPQHYSEVIRGQHTLSQSKKTASIEERLYDARALCKIKTASVAMYLPSEWRSRFFLQLDNLLDAENWEDEDTPIIETSFTTFLRMLLLIWPVRRPGLGSTSEGNIIASWTAGKDRLTIECLAGDQVRWVLSCYIEGKRESAAGVVSLPRLLAVLAPYNPEHWLADGSQEE